MGNESADPTTAMSLVGKIEMQGKMCEVKAATPREGTRDRREDPKKMPLFNQNPAIASGVPPPPVMYGYPLIGYPANVPPPAMYYPPAPYMDYSQPNGYDGFMMYPQLDEALVAPQSGAPIIPLAQPPYPIGVPPQPLLPAVLAVPQPHFPAGGIPPPPSDVPVPLPYIGIPVTAYGMPSAPVMEQKSFHYLNGQQQQNSETV